MLLLSSISVNFDTAFRNSECSELCFYFFVVHACVVVEEGKMWWKRYCKREVSFMSAFIPYNNMSNNVVALVFLHNANKLTLLSKPTIECWVL
jgi:hypothetical protein